jgi:hypothetical protein
MDQDETIALAEAPAWPPCSAAERLGNSRGVWGASVHPAVTDAFREGRLREAWRQSKAGLWRQGAESAVMKLRPDDGSAPPS